MVLNQLGRPDTVITFVIVFGTKKLQFSQRDWVLLNKVRLCRYHESNQFYSFPFYSLRMLTFRTMRCILLVTSARKWIIQYNVMLKNVELFIDSFRFLAGVCENSIFSPSFDRICLFWGGISYILLTVGFLRSIPLLKHFTTPILSLLG